MDFTQHLNHAVLAGCGAQPVAGVDEVGRGCLAGPVYAAAVILPRKNLIAGLRDSKKLSQKNRERLAAEIYEHCIALAIGRAEVAEIDQINILQATFLAMRRAISNLKLRPALCLIDGNQNPSLDVPVKMIIGGDNIEPSIMAASIVAKVARDAEMRRLDGLYPGYGLLKNKGYGTATHLAGLAELGASKVHRLSFAPCARARRNTSEDVAVLPV